ncbi:MAG: SDR family oxidoreductase [Phycisphaerales bacterium]|jgi:3-oxoacyl-[acyl-carrier protein] reductase|nr:SDR family oxidoreductase [Phycisphaerales bacterium]
MMLKDKTCLITGGGTGIGKSAAKRFAEEGARVWITGRQQQHLAETAAAIGSACVARQGDVTDVEQMRAIVHEMPALDIVVSNAAVSFPVDPINDPPEKWRQMLEVNAWGTINVCRIAGERMIQQGTGGRIIIVSSILAELAEPGSAPYGMAKAAINQLARQLAVEWATHDILVNVVAPGFVHTPMSYVSGSNELESEWCKTFFLNPRRPRVPLLRPGEPDEVAEAILFFANPRNTYCTGSILTVDGGLTVSF